MTEEVTAPQPTTALEIPVDLIDPNPEQPRKTLDEASLQELAESIREHGVLQALRVEMQIDSDRYTLIAGERRWRAARLAGLATVPCIVRINISSKERLIQALVENVQREDMTPLEIARAYERMHDELGMTDQQIAGQVGKSRSTITNARRLLALPPEVQELASQDGVSERQLLSLLPMYQLPADALHRAEGVHWSAPSQVIRDIRSGKASSETVREGVARVINNATKHLEKTVFPLDHEFTIDGIQSPSCDKCNQRIVLGKGEDKKQRCPIADCFQAKEVAWKTEQLRLVIEATGIPVREADLGYSATEYFYGYGESELLSKILEAGCQNLRLEYVPGFSNVPGHENARALCQHSGSNRCACLQKLKLARSRNDPEKAAEKEREKRLKAEIVEPYSAAIARAIVDGNVEVWRRIMRGFSYHLDGKGADWDLDTIRRKISEAMVDNVLPYDAHNKLDQAMRSVQRSFDEMGLAYPGQQAQETAGDFRGRLDRIQRWVRSLENDAPAIEAVRGNLANLEKLTDEFDQVADQHVDDERLDGFLQDLADTYERLHELYVIMVNPMFSLDGFDDHAGWLLHTPSSDLNFTSHLQQASPSLLRYVLALVDGRDGDKTRAEALQRQLRKLENGR